MRLKVCLITLALVFSLSFSSCTKKVATTPGQASQASKGDQLLAGAKRFGRVLSTAVDDGITLEATLAESGTIDSSVEPQIRQWLQDGKKGVADFNMRIGKYDHLDADSKKVIADFIGEAVGFVDNLNNNGILRIKNPKSQLIAGGILLGAKTAISLYKDQFDAAQ